MIANMRYRLAAVAGYFALMTPLIYDTSLLASWLLVPLVVLHIALGAVVARWWAPLLPLLLVAIAIPAGYPEPTQGSSEEFPMWFDVAFGDVFLLPLVLIGYLARKVGDYILRSRSRPGMNESYG
jgi:uncharacterized membrane protein YhdT